MYAPVPTCSQCEQPYSFELRACLRCHAPIDCGCCDCEESPAMNDPYALWTMDNTTGYTQAELNAFNTELAERLTGIEPHTDEWYRIISRFTDEVAGR
jgi:hypothetical protein